MKIIMTLGLVAVALLSTYGQENTGTPRQRPQTVQMVNVDTWLQDPIDRYTRKGKTITAVVLATATLNDGTPVNQRIAAARQGR